MYSNVIKTDDFIEPKFDSDYITASVVKAIAEKRVKEQEEAAKKIAVPILKEICKNIQSKAEIGLFELRYPESKNNMVTIIIINQLEALGYKVERCSEPSIMIISWE